jgi:hypothetical protein
MYSIYTILHAAPHLQPDLDQKLLILPQADLLGLARSCGFVRRVPRKLDLRGFVFSCMVLALQQTCSLRNQAILAGLFAAGTLSKQALHARLATRAAILFLQGCLASAISSKLSAQPTCRPIGFGRILVQDSTCLALHSGLAALFPGPANHTGSKQASLRIQCIYDLLTERFLSFALSPFTRNDQASACDLLPLLQAGDLVLRDLGYFTFRSFKAIAAKGAFFLSRWRYGVTLLCPQSGQEIDLAKRLRPGRALDIEILLGQQEKIPVRLLAFPLSPSLATERRRKARTNRDRRLNHNKDYFQLLAWNIFLTNASKERLPWASAAKLYGLRWRVEILFKAWKSQLGLKQVSKLGRRQLEVLVYGLLLFVVLMHNNTPLACAEFGEGLTASPQPSSLSLLRLAEFFGSWLLPLLLANIEPRDLLTRMRQQIQAHCRYDSRQRKNYMNKRSEALS